MTKTLTLAAIAMALYAGPAAAQANRTFVSGTGNDANPCTLAAPCRSFAQAITQTNPGGEIAVLDSAGYGPVTITQSVSIIAPDGVIAGITTSSATAGITIAAGVSDTVNLRGLTLEGGGVGTNGIILASGGGLNIANCVVRNFSNVGIFLAPSPASPANYTVIDTTIANNASVGIYLAPASGNISGQPINLFLKHDVLLANGDGLRLNAGVNNSFQGAVIATIVDVAASGNTGNGFALHSLGGGVSLASAIIHNSQAAGSPTGLLVDNSQVWLAGTVAEAFTSYNITNNGTISSFGNNELIGLTGVVGTLTPFSFH